ncbi:LOG family protein [Niallia endozanthoxylica]|uniref:Cytokinin riboside 5'-monophosphate phosphoribohydrolase n=1 Tax=Niallia endozanthoxylica TaxID=2036016 RepID=A0A5J5HLN6_9BACI|nr:TIGR00730 family Rossman fold protein [Niallia endozanthoxylica]KAA9021611.1 TIGR00730 family Rossman fold protein [Niallia endozanthoxylica]
MKGIAVYCGSRSGASDVYIEGAKSLGMELARRKMTLIYGGSSAGMMGAVADSCLEAGGRVVGVMPQFLDNREKSHKNLSELIIVESMHERKSKMSELADGFIALPGGPGTLEEFFEIFTWAQVGLHQKPIGLLNINHYFDPIVELFNHMADEHFMEEKHRLLALVDEQANGLLNQFSHYLSQSCQTNL